LATFTTRLGLRKPATTDLVNVTTDLGANMDAIDAAVGASVVTSITRPGSPYAGQAIFETDTHNNLLYSGGWYHDTIPVVPGTGSILNPYNFQLIYNTTDGLLYRYDSGTASWFKATAYARYALTGASTVALGSGADTLMQFPTAITTDPRVVAGGGGNTQFTLTPGRWTISAALRTSANTSMGLYLGTGTTANEANAFASASTNTFTNAGVSDTVEFTTSTTVVCFVWSNTSVNAVSQGLTGQGVTHISFVRNL